jgi:hydrogenase nickel incorporation protein HypA/HybF
MHELSLAGSVLAIARRAVPPGAALRSVRVVVGPMRAVDPDAMQFAWQAVTARDGAERVRLELDLRPWTLRCPECGSEWDNARIDCACAACGSNRAFPPGGDELQVASIEVDEELGEKGALPCETFPLSRM